MFQQGLKFADPGRVGFNLAGGLVRQKQY